VAESKDGGKAFTDRLADAPDLVSPPLDLQGTGIWLRPLGDLDTAVIYPLILSVGAAAAAFAGSRWPELTKQFFAISYVLFFLLAVWFVLRVVVHRALRSSFVSVISVALVAGVYFDFQDFTVTKHDIANASHARQKSNAETGHAKPRRSKQQVPYVRISAVPLQTPTPEIITKFMVPTIVTKFVTSPPTENVAALIKSLIKPSMNRPSTPLSLHFSLINVAIISTPQYKVNVPQNSLELTLSEQQPIVDFTYKVYIEYRDISDGGRGFFGLIGPSDFFRFCSSVKGKANDAEIDGLASDSDKRKFSIIHKIGYLDSTQSVSLSNGGSKYFVDIIFNGLDNGVSQYEMTFFTDGTRFWRC
jgi:hypothetical protein